MNGRGLLVATACVMCLGGCGYQYVNPPTFPSPDSVSNDLITQEQEWASGTGGLAFEAIEAAVHSPGLAALAETAAKFPPPIHRQEYITSMEAFDVQTIIPVVNADLELQPS